jgi:hypothetical protein
MSTTPTPAPTRTSTRTAVITWHDKKGHVKQLTAPADSTLLEQVLNLQRMKISYCVTYLDMSEVENAMLWQRLRDGDKQ